MSRPRVSTGADALRADTTRPPGQRLEWGGHRRQIGVRHHVARHDLAVFELVVGVATGRSFVSSGWVTRLLNRATTEILFGNHVDDLEVVVANRGIKGPKRGSGGGTPPALTHLRQTTLHRESRTRGSKTSVGQE